MAALANLLFFLLATIGTACVVVDSDIGKSFKDWCEEKVPAPVKDSWLGKKVAKMANCYQCAGWWAGLFWGFCLLGWHVALPAAFAGSFASMWGAQYLAMLEAQTIVTVDDGEYRNT